MGRELKRVALDFDWPVGKVWGGYLNPFYTAIECVHCDGSGYSPVAARLQKQWYGNAPFSPESRGSVPMTKDTPAVRSFAERNVERSPEFYGCGETAISREADRLARLFNEGWLHHLNQNDVNALVAAGRLMDLTHNYVQGGGWQKKDPPYTPSADEVNEWSVSGFGHDAINCWVCIRAECERLGEPEHCHHCDGEGCVWPSEKDREKYEQWQKEEPPSGDGYQIWETVSEGSPISPVFSTPESLARHMAGTRWGADKGTSFDAWMSFISGPGWAPSMISSGGVLRSGVAAMADD